MKCYNSYVFSIDLFYACHLPFKFSFVSLFASYVLSVDVDELTLSCKLKVLQLDDYFYFILFTFVSKTKRLVNLSIKNQI